MSTPAAPTAATATKLSFWQKIEGWFHKEAIVIENDLKALLSSQAVKDLESGFTALAKSEFGQIASIAVTAAMDVETGVVNFGQAYNAIATEVKAAGKTLTDSAITALIAAAQQKIQQFSHTTQIPAPAPTQAQPNPAA